MHVVVLQHGLWGSNSNTRYLADLLGQRLGSAGFVLNYHDNVKFVDHDGIDVCGERLFEAVKSTHDDLVHQCTPPTHISFIGYSAGGLINRYVIGRLFSESYFDHVTPLNFVTVATPHLGSWRAPGEPLARLVNALVPPALSRTGAQLFLSDVTPWGPPLLCVLAAPGLPFMAALRSFQSFVAMANVRHDRIVSFRSAAMQLKEPYPARGFDQAVSLVDLAYPSIVQPRKPGEGLVAGDAAAASPVRRRLRGGFLLGLVVTAAVLLSPLLPLVGLTLLVQGWLHRRSAAAAAAESTLRQVYDSWGGSGSDSGGAADSKQPSMAQSQKQLHQGLELQGRAFVADVETGVSGGGVPGSVPGGGASVAVTVAVNANGKGAAVAAEDRVPLHKEHLRQQQQEAFAGLPPPTDKRGLQEWLAARLSVLPVRRVHVDTCNVLHAHSAIIVWNRLFLHCRDALQYALDACMVWA